MPWARIDDSFYDHPKLDRLGPERLAAVGLHVLALSWCNRHLTDGFVPDARVIALGGTVKLADVLVKAGMWDQLPDQGGYLIHDFDHYNKTKRQVVTERRQWRDRQGKARGVTHMSRRDTPRDTDRDDPVTDSVSHAHVQKSRSRSRSRTRLSNDSGTGRGESEGGWNAVGSMLAEYKP